MNSPFKYRAFISYSHSDEKWARWLHRRLETYRLPRNLVGRETAFGPVPARFTPVFRDRDELATATSLGATLVAALEQSACQIVICSPKAAQSRWVNEEILTFKRLGREDRIFCLVVAGEPGVSADPARAAEECFPPALIRKLGPDGELTEERGEPIAADVRPGKDRPATAMLKLAPYRKLEPGGLEEALFFHHPSGRSRIEGAMRWKAQHMGDADIRDMAGPGVIPP